MTKKNVITNLFKIVFSVVKLISYVGVKGSFRLVFGVIIHVCVSDGIFQ